MKEERAPGWVFWGYNVGIVLVSVLILPWLLWKIVSVRNRRTDFLERMGLRGWRKVAGQRPLWLHTVSVGEVLSTGPFVRELKKLVPGLPIVLSSITPAGRTAAGKAFGEGERVICFPFDYPVPVLLALRKMHPCCFVATETEIWPYFLLSVGRKGIPAAILNGRISEASCRRFGWFRFFMRHVLRSVQVFAMQSRTDCLRVIRIGADPRRVFLTGNMKFDVPVPEDEEKRRRSLREEMGWAEDCPVLVAGSTHEGEERILLDVYGMLKKELPRLRIILAPRHPERSIELQRFCKKERFSTRCRTDAGGKAASEPVDVLLLDTMGELAGVYAAADLVFLGGTLVPIGGHNPLEPILYRKPVLFGPHTEKIRDIVDCLLHVGGGIRVRDREELLAEARRLIEDPEHGRSVGRAAYRILAEHRGATERNLAILRPFLYPDDVDPKPADDPEIRAFLHPTRVDQDQRMA